MAIVTALRFTENSGGICVDQESWHIWRRKNWFTDHLYPLVPEKLADKFGIEVIYGGVGHPQYHYEVAQRAVPKIESFLADHDESSSEVTVESVGKCVLEAFQEVHFRRVSDKLQYLFGFDVNDYTSGTFQADGNAYEISQQAVRERAMNVFKGKETTGYSPLSPPVEACLIGTDQKYGYSAFALKEIDGVLGFQSCWFESLGQGRDGAAIQFAKQMNAQFLETRREGIGQSDGLFFLLNAIAESMDHYGQNGGSIRLMILNGSGRSRTERIIDIQDDRARLAMEIVQAIRADLIAPDPAKKLLNQLVVSEISIVHAESQLFGMVEDPCLLGKLLRGYKINEGQLPGAGPEQSLFETVSLQSEERVSS